MSKQAVYFSRLRKMQRAHYRGAARRGQYPVAEVVRVLGIEMGITREEMRHAA